MLCCCCRQRPADTAAITENEENAKINKMLVDNNTSSRVSCSMLLIGTGEGGKSTFFKQLRFLNKTDGGNVARDETILERDSIHRMLINDTITIVRAATLRAVRHSMKDAETSWSKNVVDLNDGELPTGQNIKKRLNMLTSRNGDSSKFRFTVGSGELINAIWTDPLTVKMFPHRALFQIGDHAKFFFDRIMKISDPKWLPDEEEIVRARIRSTGVMEQTLRQDTGATIKIIDVGGQRSERHKWVHQFEQVSAVLFVCAISEYNQTCLEDNETPRSIESLTVFRQICREPFLRKAGIIVIFNKLDVLKEKLSMFPFLNFAADYAGSGTLESVCRYTKNHYQTVADEEAANHADALLRPFSFHFTTAIDKNNVSKVFQCALDIVTQRNLNASSNMAPSRSSLNIHRSPGSFAGTSNRYTTASLLDERWSDTPHSGKRDGDSSATEDQTGIQPSL